MGIVWLSCVKRPPSPSPSPMEATPAPAPTVACIFCTDDHAYAMGWTGCQCWSSHPLCEPCLLHWFRTKRDAECPICHQPQVNEETGEVDADVRMAFRIWRCPIAVDGTWASSDSAPCPRMLPIVIRSRPPSDDEDIMTDSDYMSDDMSDGSGDNDTEDGAHERRPRVTRRPVGSLVTTVAAQMGRGNEARTSGYEQLLLLMAELGAARMAHEESKGRDEGATETEVPTASVVTDGELNGFTHNLEVPALLRSERQQTEESKGSGAIPAAEAAEAAEASEAAEAGSGSHDTVNQGFDMPSEHWKQLSSAVANCLAETSFECVTRPVLRQVADSLCEIVTFTDTQGPDQGLLFAASLHSIPVWLPSFSDPPPSIRVSRMQLSFLIGSLVTWCHRQRDHSMTSACRALRSAIASFQSFLVNTSPTMRQLNTERESRPLSVFVDLHGWR